MVLSPGSVCNPTLEGGRSALGEGKESGRCDRADFSGL